MNRIITTEIAARELGISPQRVRQLIQELGLKPQQIGNALVLSPDDLKRLRARKRRPGPSPQNPKAS